MWNQEMFFLGGKTLSEKNCGVKFSWKQQGKADFFHLENVKTF